ncbi:MAG TPA: hypothetical protein VJK66_03455 [Gaiellaceae bacterium]|nr:hypothetical protein [Gaiellaceae bacterium]HLE98797.1 hypothetical protein [Gaiellaceae bacterium]
MRRLVTLVCMGAVSTALVGVARGAEDAGMLSIERGKGAVVLEIRGVVLGRLGNGTITVIDRTPNDPYVANVTGRRVIVQRRPTPARLFIRGQGLRFRMLGGGYRILIRGSGITVSAVGRGAVSLDGEPRFPGDDVGVYSLEGVDCSLEPESCDPIPDEPVRVKIGKTTGPPETERPGAATR